MSSGLPAGWEARQDRTGRLYFVNHVSKSTQWEDPRPMPNGWEMKSDDKLKRKYFIDHLHKTTSWTDPRPPLIMPMAQPSALLPHGQIQPGYLQHQQPVLQPQAVSAGGLYGQIEGQPNLVVEPEQKQASAAAPRSPSLSASYVGPLSVSGAAHVGGGGAGIGHHSSASQDLSWYKDVLQMSVADKTITADEDRLLAAVRTKLNISDTQHAELLKEAGLSTEEFQSMKKEDNYQRECVVCLDESATHIILDCFHLCLGEKCAKTMLAEKEEKEKKGEKEYCPKCRAEIRLIHKTY